jgi:hypothetical protein
MLDCVFCIDFGSAYTKVSLRPAAQDSATLLKCDDSSVLQWAPTVAAVEWAGSEQKWLFGYAAADVKPSATVTVLSNFKKDLFATASAEAPSSPPLETLLRSQDFNELAAKHGVLPPEIAALRSFLASARALAGTRPNGGPPASERRLNNAKIATTQYLKWLRGRILAVCGTLPNRVLRYEDIPARLAVPALGGAAELASQPGCRRLREAAEQAGWKLDEQPFVSEPEANALGVLTHGTNALTPKKKKINFREMFSRGPLITVLAGDKHHPTYRALIIDVGAFTTDFASLWVDTKGRSADTSDGAGFAVTHHSVAIGMTNLDAEVLNALAEDKRAALSGLARRDFEGFQNGVYADGIGYRAKGRVIGGEADRPAVQKCISNFTGRLAAETAAFCQQLGPAASMQELILTGGGSNIPAVRDALLVAAQAAGGFVKTHAPNLRPEHAPSPLVDRLDTPLSRGASALGGASVYFERACY